MKRSTICRSTLNLREESTFQKPLYKRKHFNVYSIKCKEKEALLNNTINLVNSRLNYITVSSLMFEWLNSISLTVKQSTYQKYECLIRNHIYLTEFGNIGIHDLNCKMINEFASKLMKKLSAKSVNDILVILNLGLAYAEDVYNTQKPKFHFVKEPLKDMRVLSLEEQRCLETYLCKDMDICKLGVLLALYTGIRVGELCALQWEDIKNDGIVISKTMHRIKKGNSTVLEITEPKTKKSNRIIPMPEFLSGYIEQYRASGSFLQLENGKVVEPRLMQYKFDKYIMKCGLPHTNFHALRHTFATRCVEAGFDIKSLSEILGHTDVRTTLNKYVHSSFEQKRKNMSLLSPATDI